ncbi:MAG: hypothetical protein ACHQX1_02445 [Candidatus Micrarchaeales archaeon]
MRAKNEIKNELVAIKKELEQLKSKETEMQNLVNGKDKSDQISSNLFTLLKYMMDENKTTRNMIEQMYKKIEKFEEEINADLSEEPGQGATNPLEQGVTTTQVVPISELDKRIIQHIQIVGMACADDVKKHMNYKGRNAASARLNKLYRQGIIERYQLGHKVFYKYDAGKTTKSILIVSPPQ